MLHWKTKVYLDIREKGNFSGSGGSENFTVMVPDTFNPIITIPTEANQFLDMAWMLIQKANALIEKEGGKV